VAVVWGDAVSSKQYSVFSDQTGNCLPLTEYCLLTTTMKLLTRENLLAVLLCLLAVLLLIVATDSAPQWIYQGF